MTLIPFPNFTPDTPDFAGSGGEEALNVIPDAMSYRPFPSYATYTTNALTARAQGAFYTRASDSSARNFAGDATKLYMLDLSVPTTWDDVTRLAGGAYGTPSDGFWRFCRYGLFTIAVNGADNPQTFNVDSDTNFSLLGGTPPVAKYVQTIRDFLVMASTSSNRLLVQWSGINNSTQWSQSQTTMSDSQTLPDGGNITGLMGGEYGIVFQENAITRMTFTGPPTIFQFDKISRNLGCTLDGSLAIDGVLAIFANRRGFFMLIDGQTLNPIGSHVVDRYFWTDVDTSNLNRITSAIDPTNKLYIISYPGAGNSSGTPNHMLIYNYEVNRWARSTPGDLEMVYFGATQAGQTLESLDNINTSIDALPFSLDSSIYQGVAVEQLGAFGTDHKLGYFSGAAQAATMDTDEFQPTDGRRSFIRGIRPMVEGGAVPSALIGYRNLQSDAVTWSASVTANANGMCPFRIDARYMRARVQTQAGDTWTHAMGVDEQSIAAAGKR